MIIGTLLFIYFWHRIKAIIGLLYVAVLAALAGMILLRYCGDICKRVATAVSKRAIRRLFQYMVEIIRRLSSYIPSGCWQAVVDFSVLAWCNFWSLASFVANDISDMVIETVVLVVSIWDALVHWFRRNIKDKLNGNDGISRGNTSTVSKILCDHCLPN